MCWRTIRFLAKNVGLVAGHLTQLRTIGPMRRFQWFSGRYIHRAISIFRDRTSLIKDGQLYLEFDLVAGA